MKNEAFIMELEGEIFLPASMSNYAYQNIYESVRPAAENRSFTNISINLWLKKAEKGLWTIF